jgi:hypothetical protein
MRVYKMHNPEKLAAYVTQDEDKQHKNTAQYVLGTTMRNCNNGFLRGFPRIFRQN